MDVNHNNNVWRRVVEEDRLSSLPDELIHKILSCFDMKYAVQTCLLSSRWEFLWKSVPCLNFSTRHFHVSRTFSKFVTKVLSRRNHQSEVSSVKLHYHGAVNQGFVKKIAKYAFSHNIQELTVVGLSSSHTEYPPYLFSSQSLKHLTLQLFTTTKTPLDFPALTTLNLIHITFCGDLFSKCVNLKNLTLEHFYLKDMEVFDIITPRLSNLMLIDGRGSKTLNLVAPQLENLTIFDCSIEYLNAAPGLSSFCYTSQLWCRGLLQLSKCGFHSLNKVSICLYMSRSTMPYKEEDARKIINMLQELHSAKYLTLNTETVECISSFPDLLSQHPSPFSNLICLTIYYSKKKDACKVTMSSEARNFLLENSPRVTFTMNLPKFPCRR